MSEKTVNKDTATNKVLTDLLVKVEKSEFAKKLEQTLGISWDLEQHFEDDAGYDVRATIDRGIVLPPNRRVIVPTGLFIELGSPNYEIQVRPRSGIAWKNGVTVLNSPGTVDYGYREEIKVILINTDSAAFSIFPGDRIAQICFKKVPTVKFDYVDAIEKTPRSGIGSSGTK